MLKSVEDVKAHGAAGVVFGILNQDSTIDVDRMKTLISAARPMKVVCHKAFDDTPKEDEALDQLISLGVDEVLTSGHQKTAVEGVKNLKSYKDRGQ